MKAVVCTRYGATQDVVTLMDLPVPTIGDQEVLIEVHAASVNPIDYKIQQGAMKAIRRFAFPLVLGYDVSGVVSAIGAGVTRFKPGDAVFSRVDSHRFGTFAEFVAVDQGLVASKPANLTHQQAAALPLVSLTSWQALHDIAALQPSQRVLIHAGAGGIGSVAIQLAKHLGAHVTTTTSTRNVELVKSLGADAVIDYTHQAFEQVGAEFDVVYETLGGENLKKSLQVVRRGGVLVNIAGMPSTAWARAEGVPWYLLGVFMLANLGTLRRVKQRGVRYIYWMLRPDGETLGQLGDLARTGKLVPLIDRIYPLDQTREALLFSQSGRARGKIVIQVK